MLADDPAGMTFRETILFSDAVDRLPASLGGYKFPEATSASTCFSKDRSATSRRNRAFSRPRSFIRRAWSICRPPYALRQRESLCSEISASLQARAKLLPYAVCTSIWRSFSTTCFAPVF